ncbi:UNVERIFIED_CONTAM: hypothetical protein PYX00_001363 [Menopon gallinae]|uniref:Uncharacterized protein n=1 Tax=Menopon gallinae TaxID=328185 RepID=A0AAW2ID70_9NEOP
MLKLSLLYLLLIIPLYGNSPVPRMETWMEMDQGDGFVDRDLTSSLTGAESFGSAHKNYQNALIRKKQDDNEDETENDGSMNMFYEGMSNAMQRRSPMSVVPIQNQYSNYPYTKYMANLNQPMYMNRYAMKGDRFRMPLGTDNMGPSYYRNQRYNDLFSPGALGSQDQAVFVPNSDKLTKCSVCQSKNTGFDPDAALNTPEGSESYEESEYSPENEGRMKNKLNDEELCEEQFEEDDPGMEESDYYNEDRNPALVGEDASDTVDADYSQINPHGIIYKREENKSLKSKSLSKGDEGLHDADSKLKAVTKSDPILPAVAPKEGHEIPKSDTKLHLSQDNDAIWKAKMQSKELSDVMRDSQRALEEVQMYQQKLTSKPQYSYHNFDWKADNYLRGQKRNLEEGRRNKREDEDEQKNMKTGSDEGGGEYEDEEGKGHNDEEEYYEEAEFDGRKTAESGPLCENYNCFHKREANKDVGRRDAKNVTSSEDHDLTLENAPVEHEDRSKKYVVREGNFR